MKLDANEPVRRNLYLAATVVAVSTLCGSLAAALQLLDPVSALGITVAVLGAIAAASAQFAVIAFGVERARDRAWGPQTVDRIIDAEADIADAERRGLGQ